jgi:WD40 repeat protein
MNKRCAQTKPRYSEVGSHGAILAAAILVMIVFPIDKIQVARVKFSADGKTIACSEAVQTSSPKTSSPRGSYEIRLRDARTGQPLPKPTIHSDYIFGFALSPDGSTLALELLGCPTSKMLIIDTTTGKTTQTFDRIAFGEEWDIAFSPDGHYLAARPDNDIPGYGLDSMQLVVWELATGKCLYRHATNSSTGGMFNSIGVRLDPIFFTSNQRLVCSDSVMDLDRKSLSLCAMIPDKDMRPGLNGSRLFVGFIEQNQFSQDSHPRFALFHTTYWKKNLVHVSQWELWDIETKKQIKIFSEPSGYDSVILDYSPIAHLVARCHEAILILQRV